MSGAAAAPRVAAVVVTFGPDPAILRRQFAALEPEVLLVVVDNASPAAGVQAVQRLVEARPGAVLLRNPANLGLAAGLNAGARAALEREPGCEYLLFLDQDTEPPGTAGLVAAAAQLRAAGVRLGLLGPLMVDAETGLSHGVHVIRGPRWTRIHPAPGAAPPVRCASVNGSGALVPAAVYRELGGFDDALFIDHVDSEWSFRVAAAGYGVWTAPAVRFRHRMGARTLRVWLGRWRLWPYRTPARHYYLFRNAVALMRRDYVPAVWKVSAVAKLLLTALVHGVADPARWSQLRGMWRGVRAGLAGETGPAGGGAP